MPPQLLFDISGIDLNKLLYGPEEIRKFNPQRGDMEHLDGVVYIHEATNRGIGFKDVRADEFWTSGHIPGRPLLPGVLMIETAAQLASFYSKKFLGFTGFMGFGGCTDVKFRAPVVPGDRLYILLEKNYLRHGRVGCRTQGIVGDTLVFEGSVMGVNV